MSIQNFNATVWAGEILSNLRKTHIAGMAVNRNYEGEISAFGEKVKINSIGSITSKDYTSNSDMDAPDTLSDSQKELEINQAKYVNFQVDDIDKAQQRPKVMSEAMTEAAHSLSDASDSYILGLFGDADHDIGSAGDAVTLTTSNVYEKFVEAATLLDESNVPRNGGRWAIVPPWVHALLVKSDEFLRATSMGDAVVMNGMVGQIAGFNVLMSNNVAEGDGTQAGEYRALFGYPGAITFAEQILNLEAYRPERRFADAVKGLYAYGAKVVRPTGLVAAHFEKSA